MFTGIIETTARVELIEATKYGKRFVVRSRRVLKGLKTGQSIAVNGVCLTIIAHRGRIAFDVIPETLRVSDLAQVKVGDSVNLERALKYGQRMDGHYVLGHVDACGRIRRLTRAGGEVVLSVTFPRKLKRYIVPKGSIALEGVSLTVARVHSNSFDVCLIPHTLKTTNLKSKTTGQSLSIEVDILLKGKQTRLR